MEKEVDGEGSPTSAISPRNVEENELSMFTNVSSLLSWDQCSQISNDGSNESSHDRRSIIPKKRISESSVDKIPLENNIEGVQNPIEKCNGNTEDDQTTTSSSSTMKTTVENEQRNPITLTRQLRHKLERLDDVVRPVVGGSFLVSEYNSAMNDVYQICDELINSVGQYPRESYRNLMLTQLTRQLLDAVHTPTQNEDENLLRLQMANDQLTSFINQSEQSYKKKIADLNMKLSVASMEKNLEVKRSAQGHVERETIQNSKLQLAERQQFANSFPSLTSTSTATHHKEKKRRRSSSFKFWKRRSSASTLSDDRGSQSIGNPMIPTVPEPKTEFRSVADSTLISNVEKMELYIEEMRLKLELMEEHEATLRSSIIVKDDELKKLRLRISKLDPENAILRHAESQAYQMLKFADNFFHEKIIAMDKVKKSVSEQVDFVRGMGKMMKVITDRFERWADGEEEGKESISSLIRKMHSLIRSVMEHSELLKDEDDLTKQSLDSILRCQCQSTKEAHIQERRELIAEPDPETGLTKLQGEESNDGGYPVHISRPGSYDDVPSSISQHDQSRKRISTRIKRERNLEKRISSQILMSFEEGKESESSKPSPERLNEKTVRLNIPERSASLEQICESESEHGISVLDVVRSETESMEILAPDSEHKIRFSDSLKRIELNKEHETKALFRDVNRTVSQLMEDSQKRTSSLHLSISHAEGTNCSEQRTEEEEEFCRPTQDRMGSRNEINQFCHAQSFPEKNEDFKVYRSEISPCPITGQKVRSDRPFDVQFPTKRNEIKGSSEVFGIRRQSFPLVFEAKSRTGQKHFDSESPSGPSGQLNYNNDSNNENYESINTDYDNEDDGGRFYGNLANLATQPTNSNKKLSSNSKTSVSFLLGNDSNRWLEGRECTSKDSKTTKSPLLSIRASKKCAFETKNHGADNEMKKDAAEFLEMLNDMSASHRWQNIARSKVAEHEHLEKPMSRSFHSIRENQNGHQHDESKKTDLRCKVVGKGLRCGFPRNTGKEGEEDEADEDKAMANSHEGKMKKRRLLAKLLIGTNRKRLRHRQNVKGLSGQVQTGKTLRRKPHRSTIRSHRGTLLCPSTVQAPLPPETYSSSQPEPGARENGCVISSEMKHEEGFMQSYRHVLSLLREIYNNHV